VRGSSEAAVGDINPFPFPPNGFQLLHHFWERSDSAFGLLVQYPWFRQHSPSRSGTLWTTTLPELSALPVFVPSGVSETAEQQERTIAGYVSRLTHGGLLSYESLHLAVPYGATVPLAPTGRSELLLEAHRRATGFASRVAVFLHWPKIRTGRDWGRFQRILDGNDGNAIEAALRG
jgi:hypothetical protein